MTIAAALARLLAGTPYDARQVGPTAWRIEHRLPTSRSRASPPDPEVVRPAENPPIIVTAVKRRQDLYDVPMAVTVISFARRGGGLPSDGSAWLAGEMEGLTLTSLGSGRNRMFLRGIADSSFNGESQSTVAVLLDGARVTYSAPDPDIRLVDIDRVEVLKGPQGSLYGTGALGGIYHVVTRKAQLDETTLGVSGGTEILQTGGAGYSTSGVVNLPLISDRAALRLVGYSTREPGWIDTGSRRDSNASDVAGARANLGIEVGNSWRLDLTAFAQWIEARDSQYVYAPRAKRRPAQTPEPHDNDLRHIVFQAARETGGLDIVLSSAITRHEVGDRLDATIGASSFGLSDPQLLARERQYRVWDNEVRVSGRAGRIEWLGGASYISARQTDVWELRGSSGSLALDDDRRTSTDTAIFGNLKLPIGSHLKAEAGFRLFHSSVKESRILQDGLVSRELRRDGMTPSLALSWRPRPERLLFLRYGSALRQGGTDIGSDGQLERLKNDELAILEAGWREQFDGGGRLDLGVHLSKWENLQSDKLLPNGLIETENAGDARILGAEASWEQPLGDAWRVGAGGTFESALLVRNALGYQLDDRRLPVVPRYSVRGFVHRDFQLGSASASLRLQMRYVGPSHLSFDPQLDRAMGKFLESRIEARAKWRGIDMALIANNLFNDRSDVFAFGNSLRFAAQRQFVSQRPRSVSFSAGIFF